MDKNHKLQRYSHKDYSELVDFPVEIVGRDGVIRRYAFEDAIRLYQRRVTFAPIRYRDRELIDAEVHHCRHRIEQLRRSYFYRFGWGTPDGQPHPEDVFGELAGELAAFLRRVLRAESRPDVRLDPLEEDSDGHSTWFLLPEGATGGMLLYVHRFDVDEREVSRERFFTTLKSLERSEGEGERLLAFHHSADCGFILTGQAGESEALSSLHHDDGVIRDITPTAWDRLMDHIRLGQYQDAFDTARRLVREQPHHRRAYVVGAALASFLGHHVDAEELAVLGALYFPDDADLMYWQGLSRWRQDDLPGAAAALDQTLRLKPDAALARFVAVVVAFERGRWLQVARLLGDRAARQNPERRASRVLETLARAGRMCALAAIAGGVSQGLGLVALVFLGWVGLVPLALGACFTGLAVVAFRHELQRLVQRQRFDDIGRWVRRAARQTPGRAGVL